MTLGIVYMLGVLFTTGYLLSEDASCDKIRGWKLTLILLSLVLFWPLSWGFEVQRLVKHFTEKGG